MPGDSWEIKWLQQFFIANLGEAVIDKTSPPATTLLPSLEPEAYYARVGHDGQGLRVPNDLDESICRYLALPSRNPPEI